MERKPQLKLQGGTKRKWQLKSPHGGTKRKSQEKRKSQLSSCMKRKLQVMEEPREEQQAPTSEQNPNLIPNLNSDSNPNLLLLLLCS